MRHFIDGAPLLSFILQTSLDNSLLLIYFLRLKDVLWFVYRDFHSNAVTPVYSFPRNWVGLDVNIPA